MNATRQTHGGAVDRHLSVVAVSRNDDHGGEMRARMQHFVDGFIAQCRRHDLAAELILVEWNPPPDRPPLDDALVWPDEFGPAKVRIVTVPTSVHADFPHSTVLPLFQMIGKNVGIRRARGRYVLATNVDILFDDAMICYLRDRLKPGVMLRVDRYDVPRDIPRGVPFDRVLTDCSLRFFQVGMRLGMFDMRERRIVGMGGSLEGQILSAFAGIRILGPLYMARFFGKRFISLLPLGLQAVIAYSGAALVMALTGIRSLLSFVLLVVRKLWPPHKIPIRTYRFLRGVFTHTAVTARRAFVLAIQPLRALAANLRLIKRESAAAFRFRKSRWLHTWACGDFTLLAREDWFHLRGYPEWAMYSWHIDSAFMFAANAHDIREVALSPRFRIYHIDHSVGSGWSPAGQSQLFGRLTALGIPYMSNQELAQWQARVAANPAAAIVNDAAWGIADRDLPEREILPRGRKSVLSSPAKPAPAITPA
jgi:hypothetical protein